MRSLFVIIGLCVALMSGAQEPQTYDFEYMDFSGDLEFNLDTGRPERISNGAEVILYEEGSAEADRLRVRAVEITFRYPEEGTQPSVIVLDGNVIVEHPQGTVVAAHAEWGVTSQKIVFTGSPKVTIPDGPTMTGERAEFDLGTGKAKVLASKVSRFQFSQTGPQEKKAPGLLSVSDVVDWPTLLTGLKNEGASESPSPGRQILQFIDPQIRRLLPGMDTTKTPPAENQSLIVKQINRALGAPGLYNEAAWAGKTVDPVVDLMLEKGTQQLSGDELVLMNRRLIEGAYPGAIQTFQAPAAP